MLIQLRQNSLLRLMTSRKEVNLDVNLVSVEDKEKSQPKM